MAHQRAADRLAVGFYAVDLGAVARREAAAQVDHAEIDTLFGQREEHLRDLAQRLVPLLEVGLLAADMEGDAVGIEPPVLGLAQQVLGHLRRAAELLAERPFGAAAIDQHAAEHARAGRHAGELLQLGLAVEGEQAHALLVGPGDVLLLLDGVAEGDAVHGDAGRLHELDLAAARGVELRAGGRQARQDLRRRIGLHGIEDVGRRQELAHAPEVVLDDVEIDHQARRLGLLLSEITKNTLGHRWGVPRQLVRLVRWKSSNGTYGAKQAACVSRYSTGSLSAEAEGLTRRPGRNSPGK